MESIYFASPYPKANTDITFEKIIQKDNTVGGVKLEISGLWQINNGWEIEIISPKKIAIKKFKIDTWGLRYLTGSRSASFNNRKFKVTGIEYIHNNIIKHTSGSDIVDGFTKAFAGNSGYNVYWYPGQFTSGAYALGLVVQKCIGYTASDNERDDSLQMGKHPWDVYRSCITDGIIQSTWGDGSYKGICIGLYGGILNATKWHEENGEAYKLYDISDHPIYVELDVYDTSKIVDIGSIECWDIYENTLKIYHKDKTSENYLRKYGLLKDRQSSDGKYLLHWIGTDDKKSSSYNISPITDFDTFMEISNKNNEYVSWLLCRPANLDFWDPIKDYYRTHTISYKELQSLLYFNGGIFASTTLDELELNFSGSNQFLSAHLLIADSNIKKLTINVADGSRVSSLHSLCRNSPKLEHLIWKGVPPIANDLSHMFEGSPNILSIPDCILWDANFVGTNLTVSFLGCSKLSRIDCKKDMVCITSDMPHTFDGCTSITYIEPIFDVSKLKPETYNVFNTWKGCTKLQHVKIKGISGIWRLDGSNHPARSDTWPANTPFTNGNLPMLDSDCVKYLFDNASDKGGELYCPQEWEITEDMIQSIKNKEWKVYINGIEL